MTIKYVGQSGTSGYASAAKGYIADYVSLHKGEGFGLTIFDAFNLNKEIITTKFGGQIDYLGKNYKGLVDYKLCNVSNMENFNSYYSNDQEWAQPDLDHAYDLMENAYLNKKTISD